MENRNIYKMKLHEAFRISNNLWITRVAGGWIYEVVNGNDTSNPVFVPFDNEFMATYKKNPRV